jgi:hypothetical protein
VRLKDGFQVCPRCGGGGCYWCRKQGWMAQCPRCGNSEPELLTKNDDEISCQACNATFEKTGELLPDPEPEKPKPAPKPVPKAPPSKPA